MRLAGSRPSQLLRPDYPALLAPLDQAIEHLITDPALSPEAADQIASVVRAMYQALAAGMPDPKAAPMTLHLRAAAIMRPGVPERLASLLEDMRQALEERQTHQEPARP